MRQAVVDLASQPIRNVFNNPALATNATAWAHFGATAQARIGAVIGPHGTNVNVHRTTYDNTTTGGPYFTARALGSEVHGPYIASAWIKSSIAHSIVVRAERYPAVTGTTTTATYNGGATWSLPANTWTRVWTAVPAVPGFPYITITLYAASGNVPLGAVIEATMGSIVPGTTLLPYCDGNTPGWRWTGTTGASVSAGHPYTLESIAGRPAAVNTTPNTLVSAPIPAMQGRTLYVAHEIVSTTSNARPHASYGASTAGSQGETGAIVFRAGATNTTVYTNRTQTSGGTTFRDTLTGARTVGRHVGVVWLNNGITTAGIEVDGAYAPTPGGVVPGTGLNPTGSLALAPDTTPTEDRPIAAYLYAMEHDTTTRRRVTAWLARMYGTPIPAGY